MAIYIPGKDSTNPQPTEINKQDFGTKRFGTYHMAARPDLYEPLRTNNFQFLVVGLGTKLSQSLKTAGLTKPTYFHNNAAIDGTSYIETIDEVLRISVDKAFVPHFSQQVVSIKRGNSTLKYAGQPTFNNGTIRIKDYIGTDAKMALMEWQNLSYNVRTEKVGLASDYKIDCILTEYTPDYIPVRSWKIYGCWISNIQESEFDASTSDNINSITATIEYDRAIPYDDETDYGTYDASKFWQ